MCRSQDVVSVVVEYLKVNELTFLHPPGVNIECDEARASVKGL